MPNDPLKTRHAEIAVHQLTRILPPAAQGDERRQNRELQRELARLRALNAQLTDEIAALRRREAHTQRLADRDGLTGLYNRRWLLNRLPAMLAEAGTRGESIALLFLDLDGFKRVNDAHGHSTGDALLASVATRIGARLRAADRVCRFGGDEFVIVLPRLAAPEAAAKVASAIARRVALPYSLGGAEICVTASIGTAIFPAAGATAELLLRCADQAMYRAKEARARTPPSRSTRRTARRAARRRDDPGAPPAAPSG